MSMKKKFLALALAGAVAMPVVANASNLVQGANVTGLDNTPQYGQVNIAGLVDTKTGQAAQGQISVELPTNMGFTVDRDGNVITASGGAYSINNRGQSPVRVDVASFTETKVGSGIDIRTAAELTTTTTANFKRYQVSLTLTGDNDKTVDLGEVKNSGREKELFSAIPAGQNATMVLNGVAGTGVEANVDRDGAQENFVIKFKISK